jgi:hypothetical protein
MARNWQAFDAFNDDYDAAIPPPRISPGMTLPRAQRTLARAEQARRTNEATFERARRDQRWEAAAQAGIRADNAARAVARWRDVIRMLSRGPYR